jgi:hypothetical protein
MATRMQQRRGTEAQWTSANPVLAAGEIGFEIDTNKFKIGDGINQWDDLSYFLDTSDLDGSFDDYIPLTQKAANNGVATLDAQGKIPLAQLGNVIDGAPDALNTLNELAAAIGDNADFITGFNTLNTTVGTLNTDVGTLSTAVGTLTTDLGDANDNVTQLISDVESINESISDLQLEKAPLAGPTFTGTVVLPNTTSIGDVSSTEIGYVNGVTSAIQTQLDDKLASSTASTTYAPLNAPTFTGAVVLPGTTSIGNVDATEIAYVNGVTSAIQTQLDAKAPTADPTFTGTVSGVTKSHVGLGNVDNTSDANKPVSTATQTALDAKADLTGAIFNGSVQVQLDLIVDGDLTVSGTTTTIDVTDLAVSDPLIYLASGQYDEDVLDIGFLAAYGEAGGDEEDHSHSGLVRDNSDSKKWKLISNVPHPVNNVVDFTSATKDTLVVGNLEATGVVFSDGTQTKQGVPSITTIAAKTDSYTLSNLNERDTIVEISKSSATTLTIPTNSSVAYPVGTTIDIIQTGTGQVTIAGAGGVTVNGTPGLKLRTQWSSATLLKRAENTWLVYGDLTA